MSGKSAGFSGKPRKSARDFPCFLEKIEHCRLRLPLFWDRKIPNLGKNP